MNEKQTNRRDRTRFISTFSQTAIALAISGAVILLTAAATIFFTTYFTTQVSQGPLAEQFAAGWRDYLKPEPQERAVYLACIVAAFPAALIGAFVATRMPALAGSRIVPATYLVGLACLILVLLGGDVLQYVYAGDPDAAFGEIPPFLALQLVPAIALAATAIFWSRRWPLPTRRKDRIVSVTLVLIAALLASARLRSADMLFGDVHFEAVFYSVTQVFGGKTILADLPAQYGLYAELLGPILHLTGLTVIGFSLLMVCLHFVSLLAIIIIISLTIRISEIRFLAGATVILFVGSTWLMRWNGPIGYEYYQLWPLRMLFPSLTVLGFIWVHRGGSRLAPLATLAATAGIGLVWNFDWGIPAYGALVACFLVRMVSGVAGDRKLALAQLAIVIMTPPLIYGIFLAYLYVKSGGDLLIADWLKYQSIFYSSGFGMLPLPTMPHPWMAVVAIYLYGLVYGATQSLRGRGNLRADLNVLLAVLGIGIFTYYQGRSHTIVLTFVIWPALLIAFIAADQALRSARLGLLPRYATWMHAPLIVIGLLSGIALLASLPRMAEITARTVKNLGTGEQTDRQINVEFIRQQLAGNHSAVILAWGQAILYAETGLVSPIAGPGLSEMVLAQDQERLLQTLLTSPQADVFVEGPKGTISAPYDILGERYDIVAISAAGLLHLQPN